MRRMSRGETLNVVELEMPIDLYLSGEYQERKLLALNDDRQGSLCST